MSGARLPVYMVCPVCGRVTSTDSGYCRHCRAPLFRYSLLETPEEAYEYDVEVGVDREGRRVGFRLEDLSKHVGVFGLTGYGKTNFVKVVLKGASLLGVGALVFDWEGEYGDLGAAGFRVVRAEEGLGLNIFDPPGRVDLEEYSLWVAELLGSVYSDLYGEALTPAMRYVLLRAVAENVERRGDFRGLLELFRKYSAETPARALTFSALYARFKVFASRAVARVFGGGDSALEGERVVVDVSGLAGISPDLARFVVVAALRLVFDRSRVSGGLRRLVVVEEAEEVVGRGMGYRPVNVLRFLLRARKRGLGLVVVSHSPLLVDEGLLKSLSNVAVFRVGDLDDARRAASMLGLAGEQSRVLLSLRVGEVLLRTFSSPAPFWCRVRRFEPARPRGDAGAALLESILREPFLSVRARRAALGLSSEEYRAAEEALVARGAVKPVFVVVGRGRPLKLYEPGVGPRRGAGVAHRFATWYIREKARELFGRDVFVEDVLGDLYSEELGLCIEVETGTNLYPGKYERLAGKCRMVVVVPVTKAAVSMLRRHALPGVRVMYLYEIPGLLRRLGGVAFS